MSDSLLFAVNYVKRGWAPIPYETESKTPVFKGWVDLRVNEKTVHDHFNGKPQNVGVLLGEPSGWLTDIDLDCPEAREVAAIVLPDTMVFGRESSPGSHWIYIAKDSKTKRFSLPKLGDNPAETICEIRSSGCQTMFPPSIHPSGEPVVFAKGPHSPALTTAEDLNNIAGKIAVGAVLMRYGATLATAAMVSLRPMSDLSILPPEIQDAVNRWFEPERKSKQNQSTIGEAVKKYNDDNPKNHPRNSGECPMCGHKECFGHIPDDPTRWCCFSASHTEPGIQGADCYTGDSLDIDAYEQGKQRHEVLRDGGYLTQSTVDQPTFGEDWNATEEWNDGDPNTTEQDTRPTIDYVASSGHIAADSARAVLAGSGYVYEFANAMATIGTQDGHQRINLTHHNSVNELLCRHTRWRRYDGRTDSFRGCPPPKEISAAIHSSPSGVDPEHQLPHLSGVTTIPTIRPDGSLDATPGYSQETQLFYAPTCELDITDNPTQFDAVRAAQDILDCLTDFPFETHESKTAWLSLLLSYVARATYNGPTPFFMITANTPGTGKTLLADLISIIVTGETAAKNPFVGKDQEMSKIITSHAIAGSRYVLIDNVPNGWSVGWPSMDAAVTSTRWQSRILGKSEMASVPLRTIWVATGNNIRVGEDSARRTIEIRVNADTDDPSSRKDFVMPDIKEYTRNNRQRLLGHAITIVRAYLLAGSPKIDSHPFGSFEEWSSVIRNSIIWAGQPDPAIRRATNNPDLDLKNIARQQLVENWHLFETFDSNGLMARDILDQCARRKDDLLPIIDALETLCPAHNSDFPTAKTLGRILASISGRVVRSDGNDYEIISNRGSHDKILRWTVEKLTK